MCQILRRGSSQDQILLQQGELLSKKKKNKQTREKQEAHVHIFQRITISWNFVSLQKRNVKTSRKTSVTGRVFTDLPPSTLKGVQRHDGSF